MKHVVKHILMSLVLLISLVLLLVGPLYYITIGESTIGGILTGAVKADYLVNFMGAGIFTSITSFLAGALLVCWIFYLVFSVKNHKRGPKKVKAKKVKEVKQVEEINSVARPIPTPKQAEVKPEPRHRIKF